MGLTVMVLGSAQDGGVPQVGCDCPNCRRARDAGTVRWASGLAVWPDEVKERCQGSARDTGAARARGRLLLDAGPDLRSQLRRFGAVIDAVALTHLHMGHYLGILEFGREVCGRRGLPVWCSEAVAAVLETNSPWRELWCQGHVVYERFVPGEAFSPLPGLAVTAYEVPHRNELGDTVGFVVRSSGRAELEPAGAATGVRGAGGEGLLYLPDADRWEGWEPGLPELVGDVELAVLDGTFFDRDELARVTGREAGEVPHPPVTHTLELLGQLAAKVVFGHLNHTNPLLDPDSPATRLLAGHGAQVAREGQVFRLGGWPEALSGCEPSRGGGFDA